MNPCGIIKLLLMITMKKTQKHYHPLLGIIILLIIAGLVGWYVRHKAQDIAVSDTTTSANQNAINTTPDSQKPTTSSGDRLLVSNQKAGPTIDIDEVSLTEPGFVTISANEGEVPGKVIAKSALINAGTKQDLIIRYPTTPGTYYAMLHSDNGNGTFDAVLDPVINSAPNTPLVVKFVVVK